MSVIELIPVFTPGGLDVGFELANASNAGCGCTTGADENASNVGCGCGVGADEPKASNAGCDAGAAEANASNAGVCSTLAGSVTAESFCPNASNITEALSGGGSFEANKSVAGSRV